jgi:hypothetical protein
MNKFGVKKEPHAILAISVDPKSSADKVGSVYVSARTNCNTNVTRILSLILTSFPVQFTTAVTNLIQGKAIDLSGAIGREVDLLAMCKVEHNHCVCKERCTALTQPHTPMIVL